MTDDLTPAGDDRLFWYGELAFDRKRTTITDDPVIVVDPERRTLRQIRDDDHSTYKDVAGNTTNCRLNGGNQLPLDTNCIEVAYIDSHHDQPVVSSASYTFPTFRLRRLDTYHGSPMPEYRPMTFALGRLVSVLKERAEREGIDSADELLVELMDAGVDGEILAAAVSEEKRMVRY